MSIILIAAAVSQAAQATPATSTGQAKDPAKVVCKLVQEVHSRVPSRICRTNAQWAQIAKEAEEEMRSSRHGRGEGYNGPSSD